MTARTCWRENEDYIATVIAEYPADFADLVSPYVVDAISSSTSHLAAELPRNLPVERKLWCARSTMWLAIAQHILHIRSAYSAMS